MKAIYKVLSIAIAIITANLNVSASQQAEKMLKDAIDQGISLLSTAIKCTNVKTYVSPSSKSSGLLGTHHFGFSFFNKEKNPVTIQLIGSALTDPNHKKLVFTNSTEKITVSSNMIENIPLDITKIKSDKPLTLKIWDTANNLQQQYEFKLTNKTIYITWQPNRQSGFTDIFRRGGRPNKPLYPQTGPFVGRMGVTAMCFSKNIDRTNPSKDTNIELAEIPSATTIR